MSRRILCRIVCIFMLYSIKMAGIAQSHTPVTTTAVGSNIGGFYQYLPKNYTSSKKYPLLIFSHGLGEVGNGSTQLVKVLQNGPPKMIKQNTWPDSFTVSGQVFQFVVLSPQFKQAWTKSGLNLKEMIDYAVKTYSIDRERIYITGISMGGGYVWNYACRNGFATSIAGIVPICGAADPIYEPWSNMAIQNLPIWAFHNQDDPTVTITNTIGFVDNFNAYIPTPVPLAKKTITPTGGHDAWTKAYNPSYRENGMNVYEWLLYHRNTSLGRVIGPYAISGIFPSSASPGTLLTVKGSNLRNISNISFLSVNGIKTVSINLSIGDSIIKAYVPTGIVSGIITLTGTWGTIKSKQTFNYIPRYATLVFPNSIKTYGDGPFLMTVTSTNSSGSLRYKSISGSGTTVNSITGAITITGAGIATILATQQATGTYDLTTVTATLTISKATQSISFPTISGIKYVGDAFSLTATSSSNLSVSYQILGNMVSNANSVTCLGSGVLTITAFQNGNNNYLAATPVVQYISVNKKAQTIIFNPPSAAKVNDIITLTGTSSAGLPITYQVTGNATLVSNVLTCRNEGVITVTAFQLGNNSYQAATPITRLITITKKAQVINFNPASTAKVDDIITLTGTSGSGLSVSYQLIGNGTITSNILTCQSEGVITITAFQVGNNAYQAAAPITKYISVNKKNQSIEFEAPLVGKVNDLITLTGTSSSGLPVVYGINNSMLQGNTLLLAGAVVFTVTAFQQGNEKYLPAPPVIRSISTIKLVQTISISALPDTTVGSVLTLGGISSSGLEVSYSVAGPGTLKREVLSLTGIGTITIKAAQAGNENFVSANEVLINLQSRKQKIKGTGFTIPANVLSGTTLTLPGLSIEGLPWKYSLVELSNCVPCGKALLTDNIISITGEGTIRIEVFYAGNELYEPFGPVYFDVLAEKENVTPVDSAITGTDIENTKDLIIYPNPVYSGFFYIKSSIGEIKHISLTGFDGKKISFYHETLGNEMMIIINEKFSKSIVVEIITMTGKNYRKILIVEK